MTKDSLIQQAFEVAAERYAAVGVDVRKALEDMKKISLSLHCWQADDVSGFENQGGSLTGGIRKFAIPVGLALFLTQAGLMILAVLTGFGA